MHVKEEILTKFQNNSLTEKELSAMLMHIATCDYCADELAFSEQRTELMKAPDYLKEQILNRTQDLDVQTSIQITQHSKELQLFLYALRTSVAVICALVILSIGTSPGITRYMKSLEYTKVTSEITTKLQAGSEWMTNSFQILSDKLLNGGNKK